MAQILSTDPRIESVVDELRLDGPVAVVTGAEKAHGAGIANAYAHAGADVALVSRAAAELEEVAALVVYLASDGASGINGEAIRVALGGTW